MDQPAFKHQESLLPAPFNRPFWVDYLVVKVFLGLIVLNLLGLNLLLVSKGASKSSPQPASQPEVAMVEATASGDVVGLREDFQAMQASLSAQLAACLDASETVAQGGGTVVIAQPPRFEHQLETIAFPGARGTNATTWWDIPGMEVTFNIGDYPQAVAYWEALLRVKGGAGEAFARIYDVDAGIPVPGSEIKTSSSNLVRVTSDTLSLWPENRTYRVQAKSLLGPEAVVEDAKIKISWMKEQ